MADLPAPLENRDGPHLAPRAVPLTKRPPVRREPVPFPLWKALALAAGGSFLAVAWFLLRRGL